MIHRGLQGESRHRNILSELCSSAAAARKEKKKQTLLPYLHFISLRWAANWALHVEEKNKTKHGTRKESEVKRERRYRWHNPVYGCVNFACESPESSARRRRGGKSLNSLHTPCLVVECHDHELVLDPVVQKNHTHNKRERWGEAWRRGGGGSCLWPQGWCSDKRSLEKERPLTMIIPCYHFSVWAHLQRNCYERQMNE